MNDTQVLTRFTKIDLSTWPKDRIEWLWSKIAECDYAFEDYNRGDHRYWLANLFMPNNESFEYGDSGYVLLTGIRPGVDAQIHWLIWEGETIPHSITDACKELLGYLYDKHDLRRATGLVPSFNQKARRLALLLGFKYEGEYREAFLYKGEFYNVQIYGLLREEFDKRWGVRS